MLLDDEDLNLLNNISENETYLEDSSDEIKDTFQIFLDYFIFIFDEIFDQDLDFWPKCLLLSKFSIFNKIFDF